jgi:hypothetical protein
MEAVRTLNHLIDGIDLAQAPFEPSEFSRAMNWIREDLLVGLRKRIKKHGPKPSPIAIKQFEREIVAKKR